MTLELINKPAIRWAIHEDVNTQRQDISDMKEILFEIRGSMRSLKARYSE